MKKTLSMIIIGLLCLSTFSLIAPQVTVAILHTHRLLIMFSYADTMIDQAWTFPNGTTFTVRGWLQSKGYAVSTTSEAFPTGEITLSGLQEFQALLALSDFFEDPANIAYIDTVLDYVSLGGGLILFGQHSHPPIAIDEALGFRWSGSTSGPVDPWSFYVDASITDNSHPVMQGITELPKAGGVFVDWDTLIDETPLPLDTAVLARTIGSGGPYSPNDRIALIAFQHGDGKVVAGPWDGLVRPYGPTAVNPWDVIAEPVVENKLLINSINWVAQAPQSEFRFTPPYDESMSGHGGKKLMTIALSDSSYDSDHDSMNGYCYASSSAWVFGGGITHASAWTWLGGSWTCQESGTYKITFAWEWSVLASYRSLLGTISLSGWTTAEIVDLSTESVQVEDKQNLWQGKFKPFVEWTDYDDEGEIELIVYADLTEGEEYGWFGYLRTSASARAVPLLFVPDLPGAGYGEITLESILSRVTIELSESTA